MEVALQVYDEWTIANSNTKLKLLKGRKTWVAEVPANGKARLTYTLVRPKPRPIKKEED